MLSLATPFLLIDCVVGPAAYIGFIAPGPKAEPTSLLFTTVNVNLNFR